MFVNHNGWVGYTESYINKTFNNGTHEISFAVRATENGWTLEKETKDFSWKFEADGDNPFFLMWETDNRFSLTDINNLPSVCKSPPQVAKVPYVPYRGDIPPSHPITSK